MKRQKTLLVQMCLLTGVLSCSPMQAPPLPNAVPANDGARKQGAASTSASKDQDTYRIRACRSDFQAGPLWTHGNQVKAAKERRWMAVLGFDSLKHAPSHSSWFTLQKIRGILLLENVDLITELEQGHVLVSGKPTDILALTATRCDVHFFDLTAVNCDCFDGFCEQLASCQLIPGTVISRSFPPYQSTTVCGTPLSPAENKPKYIGSALYFGGEVYVRQSNGWRVDKNIYQGIEKSDLKKCLRVMVSEDKWRFRDFPKSK